MAFVADGLDIISQLEDAKIRNIRTLSASEIASSVLVSKCVYVS